MAINPFGGVNQGLQEMQNTLLSLAQMKRQEKQDEQASKLSGLQQQQMQQSVDSGALSLSKLRGEQNAVIDQYGTQGQTDPYGRALSFQAQEAKMKEEKEQQSKDWENDQKGYQILFTSQKYLKEAGVPPAQRVLFTQNAMKQNPRMANLAQYITSMEDDGTLEAERDFADGELKDPLTQQPLPAGRYSTKGQFTGDPKQPFKLLSYKVVDKKADPEAMLDKRFKNQQELTQMQIDAAASRAAADRAAADRRANKKDAAKPLPVSALKLQQESTDAIGTASGIRADLGVIRRQVESGALKLGPVRNLAGAAANATGMSTENSRNLATFKTTLEKLRNDSLRLNKGVQTDGDAQRAWNELMTNINDPGVVKQRLAEIDRINERAVTLHQANIDNIRNNYGQAPLDTSAQTNVKPALGKAPTTGKPTPKLSKKAQSIADRY